MSSTHKAGTWIKTDCPVAAENRWCPVTLYRALQSQAGIHEVRYDTNSRQMEIDYDPNQLSEAEVQAAVRELARHLGADSAICLQPLQSRRGAGDRAAGAMGDNCSAHDMIGSDTIGFEDGVLQIAKGGAAGTRRSPWVTRKMRVGAASDYALAGVRRAPAEGRPTPKVLGALRAVIARLPLEPLFVAITLLTLSGGAVAERGDLSVLSWVLYLVAYLFGGYFGVQAGVASLRARRIDIDLLMVLAAIGAASVGAPFEGALLLFLFSLSNVLQNYALDRTRSAIKALSKLRPDSAVVLDSPGSERGRVLAVDQITIGSFIQVRPGDRIALDGVVERGASSVDQSSVTGESMPVEKGAGSHVLAGSINQDGELVVRVTKSSDESTIAKVITLVEKAQEQQARTERFLERFEQSYAIAVIVATVLAAVLPPWLGGAQWSVSLYRAITLMVAASPCALIISTPAAILSSIGNGARRGILFKGGVHVEQAAGIQALAFDKTGTLTEGKPRVSDIVSLCGESQDQLLVAAASLESKSQHVLAAAITAEAQARGLSYLAPSDFKSESGVGVRATVDGRLLRIGSPAVLSTLSSDGAADGAANGAVAAAEREIERLQREAKTVVVLLHEADDADQTRILGLIALEDRLRPGVREIIQELREAGIKHVAMLTGDNSVAAEQIAAQAGIDVVFAELLPENKLDAIRRIEAEYGPTAMVGDGVNDAPALAGARLGIAMGAAGTDVALETADIVLLSDDLRKVGYLIALSRRTKRTLVVNIAVAMSLIAMMIVGIYTVDLPLPLAVIGHEGGTVLVSLNGVRLLFFKGPARRTNPRTSRRR